MCLLPFFLLTGLQSDAKLRTKNEELTGDLQTTREALLKEQGIVEVHPTLCSHTCNLTTWCSLYISRMYVIPLATCLQSNVLPFPLMQQLNTKYDVLDRKLKKFFGLLVEAEEVREDLMRS